MVSVILAATLVVNANIPIVVSDDITDRVREVRSAEGTVGATILDPEVDVLVIPTANDLLDPNDSLIDPALPRGRSGLGDGTNPGLGGGRDNSPNEGTDNPNRAR